jgi:hypothetical protein
MTDKSLRKYQSRVDHLLWQYDFKKDWERPPMSESRNA